jgi:hypothetical protein
MMTLHRFKLRIIYIYEHYLYPQRARKTKIWKWLMCRGVNTVVAEATVGRGPGSSEEVWERWTNVGCNTQVHGKNTKNHSAQLSLSKTSKKCYVFLISSYVFSSTKLFSARNVQAMADYERDFYFLFYFCGVENQTQSFAHDIQVLYHWTVYHPTGPHWTPVHELAF